MRLSSLIRSGAVLQRNVRIPISGKCAPDVMVQAVLNGKTAYARSSREGNFTIYLPPMAAGGPFELAVSVPENGENVICHEIYIGEVWLCSGQSNMAYKLTGEHPDEPDALSSRQCREFTESSCCSEYLRFITVPLTATGCHEEFFDAQWFPATAENAPECSAVAAWFGHYLRQQLDIPVGLVISSWGGTFAEAWISDAGLLSNPATAEMIRQKQSLSSFKEKFQYSGRNSSDEACGAFALLRPDSENLGITKGFHLPEFDDSAWRKLKVPGSWITQQLSGNGAVWIRRKVTLPESWIGKNLRFCAGFIDKQDISYCNGIEIGRTGSGASLTTYHTPRSYPIPAELVSDPVITLAVRGYSCCFDGSFGGEWFVENCETGEKIALDGIWQAEVELDLGIIRPRRNPIFYGAGNCNTPGILFDSMIRPLRSFAFSGVIWYQGECNAYTTRESIEYFDTMKALINDWRYFFQTPELPFFIVQLAGFRDKRVFDVDAVWPHIRESQRRLASEIPAVAMATAVDCGDATTLHPQDKQSVGFRLAMAALNKLFGQQEVAPGGPEVVKYSIEAPGVVKLEFANADGLYLLPDQEQSFHTSPDGICFTPAVSAEVCGSSILIKAASPEVKSIRYAWADNPYCTLYNSDEIPASSFNIEL